ncbi:hypothetical protein DT075_23240 [Bacillus licheniformis]|nr:hypothetical protein DT075_23240 [Bacillus licheniformis]
MKLGYIMADGILLTPACALIMFSDTALYSTYSDPSAWAEAMKLCVPLDTLSGMTLTGPEMFSSLFRFFSKPLIAIIVFNGLFSMYHIPLVFDFIKTDAVYHAAITVLIFIAAFFMWWPLVHKVEELPQIEIGLFLTAMILLYASKGSPVDLLGHIMFSAHMAQMAVLYLIVPPLIILGIPPWFWKKVIFLPIVKPLAFVTLIWW